MLTLAAICDFCTRESFMWREYMFKWTQTSS